MKYPAHVARKYLSESCGLDTTDWEDEELVETLDELTSPGGQFEHDNIDIVKVLIKKYK